MSDETTPDTRKGFESCMERLLNDAHRNGVDVVGGWSVGSDGEITCWNVEVTEVVKPES